MSQIGIARLDEGAPKQFNSREVASADSDHAEFDSRQIRDQALDPRLRDRVRYFLGRYRRTVEVDDAAVLHSIGEKDQAMIRIGCRTECLLGGGDRLEETAVPGAVAGSKQFRRL